MKQLKFRSHLVPLVLSGEKTVTWRLFDDKNLSVGDTIEFFDSETGEKFAQAEATQVREKSFKELTDEDFEGHEKFSSPEEMMKTYKENYGDQVTMDTLIKMIDFKLL